MTVLVTAASKHGATREIAKEIARVLDEHGLSTELLDIDDVSDLSSYQAYIVGSGIYLWATGSRTPVASSIPTPPNSPSARHGSLPAAQSSESHPSLTTRTPFDLVSSRGWSRRHTRMSTSSSLASWTRASSACSRELRYTVRTRARATTATGTRSIAGPRRSRDS